MIKKVTVTNDLAESVVLELASPEQSGFSVREIDGLGPVKATINTRESASQDGTIFNSARLGGRNIVFKLGFLEKPSIEAVRQSSYRYFPTKKQIEILIETDNRLVKTYGHVEHNDPGIFSNDEVTNISVICSDPYLYSTETTTVDFSSVTGGFEFPFSNESLTEKLLMFGDISSTTEKDILYVGDAAVGFTLDIHILGPVSGLTIHDVVTRQFMGIDSDIIHLITGTGGLDVGDQLLISTLRGNKYITLIRDGEEINILNALVPGSSWLVLNRGINTFYYEADTGLSNIQFKLEYRVVYEGI